MLVYVGDLAPVFSGVRRALRRGGRFVFSVEAGDEQDFELASTRRYRHSKPYLERVAADSGFDMCRIETGVLRTNDGSDVDGLLALLA